MREVNIQQHGLLLDAISAEINRANAKHGEGPRVTAFQLIAILCEELGEYAQAVMQERSQDAHDELIQIVAVAMNRLTGNGPYFSSK